jgi:intracellular sulfur oxidation DsrE/DsrF family protein
VQKQKAPSSVSGGFEARLLATNLDTSYVHTWKEMPNVEECNVNFFGGSMEDTSISVLAKIDTHKVFQRQHKALKELESRITKLQENKIYFEICPQDSQNEIKMDSFHTNHV